MDPMTVLTFMVKLMNLIPAMVEGVTGAMEAFNKGTEMVEKMVAENRNPTEEEWAELNAMTDGLMDALLNDNK